MDEHLQHLQRENSADPESSSRRLAVLIERARVVGPEVYLEILHDGVVWNETPSGLQDAAILEIARQLGESFVHLFTKAYSCGGQSHRIATFKHGKTGIELNLIPGGNFQMGGEKFSDERPAHAVAIGEPFLIGRFPLRQREWDALGGEDDRHWRGEDLPIERVTWSATQTWLEKARDGLRLPSEAEWEYACRSGMTTDYFWGDAMDDAFCWYENNSGERTHDVREHEDKPNAFGLVDMIGNVWEWCQDDWIDNYSDGPSNHLARGDGSAELRLGRGGSWFNNPGFCRSAFRLSFGPEYHGILLGLRVVRGLS